MDCLVWAGKEAKLIPVDHTENEDGGNSNDRMLQDEGGSAISVS